MVPAYSPGIESRRCRCAAVRYAAGSIRRLWQRGLPATRSQLQTKASGSSSGSFTIISPVPSRSSSSHSSRKGTRRLVVGENEIADVVSGWTKIPVKKLEEEESERLRKLEAILHERVVGQEEAVSAVDRKSVV